MARALFAGFPAALRWPFTGSLHGGTSRWKNQGLLTPVWVVFHRKEPSCFGGVGKVLGGEEVEGALSLEADCRWESICQGKSQRQAACHGGRQRTGRDGCSCSLSLWALTLSSKRAFLMEQKSGEDSFQLDGGVGLCVSSPHSMKDQDWTWLSIFHHNDSYQGPVLC